MARSSALFMLIFQAILVTTAVGAASVVAPAETLAKDVEAYGQNARNASPRDAASRWLALFDRATELWAQAGKDREALQRADNIVLRLFASLPPPESWPELSRQIAQRQPPAGDDGRVRHQALRLLATVLHGVPAEQNQALGALRDTVATGRDKLAVSSPRALERIESLIGGTSHPEGIAQRFAHELQEYGDDAGEEIAVPDLFRLTNVALADALAKRAITARARLTLPGATYTNSRMLGLARRHLSSMPSPHYELIAGEADLDLFEAMRQRFPIDGLRDNQQLERFYAARHLLLVQAIRRQDGKAVLARARDLLQDHDQKTNPDRALQVSKDLADSLSDVVWTAAHLDLLLSVLRQEPRAPLWEVATRAALHLGKSESVLELAEATAARPNVSPGWRGGLRRMKWQLHLRIGTIEKAAELIREQLKAPVVSPADASQGEAPRCAFEVLDWDDGERSELAAQFAELAAHQKRKDWLADAVAAHRESLAEARRRSDPAALWFSATALARALVLQGKPDEASELLLTLQRQANVATKLVPPAFLPEIASMLAASGRHQEVVTLLNEADDWGVHDLSQLDPLIRLQEGRWFGSVAAEAIIRAGDRPKGLKFFECRSFAGHPEELAWLLNACNDDLPQAILTLERIAEHPASRAVALAWKAEALRRVGRIDDAERTARQSLAVWPTEALDTDPVAGGHQAHRTLAEVLLKKGKAAAAAEHQAAARAADLIEQADAARSVGLVGPAIDLHEQAIRTFGRWPGARARLVQLHLQHGNTEAAARHAVAMTEALLQHPLERFQLNDGLVDVFRYPVIRNVVKETAEAKLLEEPGDPRAMFLIALAQWKSKQFAEAAITLRGVVTHDAAFTPAWHLLHLCGATPADRSNAALRAGSQDHDLATRLSFREVVDLAALWELVQNMPAETSQKVGLYPLAASAQALQAAGQAIPTPQPAFGTPGGRALVETDLLRALRALMFSSPPSDL